MFYPEYILISTTIRFRSNNTLCLKKSSHL